MQTLRNGCSGSDVRALQEQLTAHGYAAGNLDGIFGPRTEAAVRAYQKAQGLAVDGIVGPKTWASLEAGDKQPGTPHFRLSEFACHNGVAVPSQYYGKVKRLMTELERVRAVWDKPVTLVSGYRTAAYNASCGGATHSQHLTANAADIQVQGVSPSAVYAKLDAMYPGEGVGKYGTFTHLDLRGYRARW